MSGCWPTAAQERLLLACFAAEPEASEALSAFTAIADPLVLGSEVSSLLPFLYRRWPSVDSPLTLAGRKAYVTLWRQNRERLLHLGELLAEFNRLGLPCVVLKGAAMTLRYYQDPGVRSMRDFDLLISERDLRPALDVLQQFGYRAERNFSEASILRQVRVGHAWQFSKGDQSCDLHWRPVVRCFSPEVTRLFREAAEPAQFGASLACVLAPTDQLFHVCAHGMQWDWHPQIRWIADALVILREPVDWDRLVRLSTAACMRVRLASALDYLRIRFEAPVPPPFLEKLTRNAPHWEQREYRLMLKECPLGPVDSLAWHIFHFRRIRPFDAAWSKAPVWIGFPQYLQAFMGTQGWPQFARSFYPNVKERLKVTTKF